VAVAAGAVEQAEARRRVEDVVRLVVGDVLERAVGQVEADVVPVAPPSVVS
jgi:hypothetical protein